MNNPNNMNVQNSNQNVEVSYSMGTEPNNNLLNEHNVNPGINNPYIVNSSSTTNNSNFMNIE